MGEALRTIADLKNQNLHLNEANTKLNAQNRLLTQKLKECDGFPSDATTTTTTRRGSSNLTTVVHSTGYTKMESKDNLSVDGRINHELLETVSAMARMVETVSIQSANESLNQVQDQADSSFVLEMMVRISYICIGNYLIRYRQIIQV